MTPADELMALAVCWEGRVQRIERKPFRTAAEVAVSEELTGCAADLRELLRSDAFRVMVRNDARYRWLRDDAPTGTGEMASVRDYHTPAEIDAAIDAAASGAGEG